METQTDNPILLAVALAVLIGAFGFVGYNYLRKRKSSWSGVVTDKDIVHQTHRNDNRSSGSINGVGFGSNRETVTTSHVIKVQTDAGKKIKWNISDGLYERIQIGDRVEKPAGTMDVSITQQAQAAAQPAPQQPAPAAAQPAQPTQPTPTTQQPGQDAQNQQPPQTPMSGPPSTPSGPTNS